MQGMGGLGEAAEDATEVRQLILVEREIPEASWQLPALQVRVAVYEYHVDQLVMWLEPLATKELHIPCRICTSLCTLTRTFTL